jgi:hypothetical protein
MPITTQTREFLCSLPEPKIKTQPSSNHTIQSSLLPPTINTFTITAPSAHYLPQFHRSLLNQPTSPPIQSSLQFLPNSPPARAAVLCQEMKQKRNENRRKEEGTARGRKKRKRGRRPEKEEIEMKTG